MANPVVHFEIPANDVNKVKEFYSSLFEWKIEGTPAITITLPILKPGARMVALWISSALSGIRAIRSRASFNSPAPWKR